MENGREALHIPVLLQEVLEHLQVRPGGIYVDATLGLGGHSEAILAATAPDGKLIALEWDEEALVAARARLRDYGDRLIVVRENFAELAAVLEELGHSEVDGILADIGLSSLQLDRGERGFSFQKDEPLDMRMDARKKITAAKLLADVSEEELADILYYYGEERQARRIAAAIIAQRQTDVIETSAQLAALVAGAVPRRFHPRKIHVATKTFQGVRIAVNAELENLAALIDGAAKFLRPAGRLCLITFHSLEDRIVKRKFREHPDYEVVTPHPVVASAQEIQRNRRSRSAKLRVAARRA